MFITEEPGHFLNAHGTWLGSSPEKIRANNVKTSETKVPIELADRIFRFRDLKRDAEGRFELFGAAAKGIVETGNTGLADAEEGARFGKIGGTVGFWRLGRMPDSRARLAEGSSRSAKSM